MPHPSFFPGNNILLEKTTIHTTLNDASSIQFQVGSDLTTMKTFGLDTWRPIIASRYASDPLVMELLNRFELQNSQVAAAQKKSIRFPDDNNSFADEPQPWQSLFQ